MTLEFSIPMRFLFLTMFAATLVACDSSTPKPKLTPPHEVKLHDPGVRLSPYLSHFHEFCLLGYNKLLILLYMKNRRLLQCHNS